VSFNIESPPAMHRMMRAILSGRNHIASPPSSQSKAFALSSGRPIFPDAPAGPVLLLRVSKRNTFSIQRPAQSNR
jgi:hypothetical protein